METVTSIERERELFGLCLEHATDEWEQVLSSHTDDPDLRERVRRLLDRHLDNTSLEGTLLRREADDPERIGPYRILQRLGEGGMGIVYAAEQREPVRRRVALKVLRVGLNSREVLARFDVERQALSLMNHPNIAHILDAGTTTDYRPYIVMEFVPGESITRYCRERKLPLHQKLLLFRSVCDAVQHAHQKGVIHRDLKPSNILVMEEDGRPVAKVIDFGIAKAAAQRLTDHTLETQVGSLLGTPEYMSPEQAELTPLDVDTRSDVYALGAVLYELLTGRPPLNFGAQRPGFAEIQRRIRDEEPVAPSRSTESPSKRTLPVELDWIALKALEKERSHRYGTAAALSEDIARFLANMPVAAGPHTLSYLARRFIRRHALGVGVSTAAFMMMTVFAVVMAWQVKETALERDRANREAEISRQVTQFTASLFELADPGESGVADISARELLDLGTRRLRETATTHPVSTRAALLQAAGNAYFALGAYAEADSLLTESLEQRRVERKEDPASFARVLLDLAALKRRQGEFEVAQRADEEALAIGRLLDSPAELSLLAAAGLAHTLQLQGRESEATAVLEPVIALHESAREHRALAVALARLSNLRVREGRFDEAEALYLQASAAWRLHGPVNADTLATRNQLGETLYFKGQYERAAEMFRELIADSSMIYGEMHERTATYYNNLAATLAEIPGAIDDAEHAYRQALSIHRVVLGPAHREVGTVHSNLGNLMLKKEDWATAVREFELGLPVRERALGPSHLETVTTRMGLAVALANLGEHARAESILRDVVADFTKGVGERHWRTGNARRHLGDTLARQGRLDEARSELTTALHVLEETLGVQHARTVVARERLNALGSE